MIHSSSVSFAYFEQANGGCEVFTLYLKNADVANSWPFSYNERCRLKIIITETFQPPLPIYSTPRTCYFWEFHLTSTCLLKISPFVKDLGVGYKVAPIISVSRISQCNHLEFFPVFQSLFFFFVHLLWFDIWRFWRFRRWYANSRKLIPHKRSFGPFPRQKIP